MKRRPAQLWSVAAALIAPIAFAQDGSEPGATELILQPLEWRVVDQGFEDVGPVSASLHREPADLRVPTGFERVYEAPGRDGMLMRADGGLRAVFPRSQYQVTNRGVRPVVPAGTVWTFGEPPAPTVEKSVAPAAPSVNAPLAERFTLAPAVARALATSERAAATTAPTRLDMSDAFFRVARLRAISRKYGPK